jgi:transcriptional regulator with XRE-family HTH domain
VEGELQRVVGENLRACRKARGLSQEAFGEVFLFHRTRMGKIERGECNLQLRTLEFIATRIELDPVLLLTPGGAFLTARSDSEGARDDG